ncbi:MAG: rod-binding protein [Desulfobacterales bacterium]|nr:rod-binding protein [Desulfobacterales bacterium]
MPGPIFLNPRTGHAPQRPSAGRLRSGTGEVGSNAEAPEQELKAACDDLEALFIHHMLSEMRKTVTKSGLTDGGRSEEIYTSLMDAELARDMARSGGLGLSRILQEQLAGLNGQPPRNFRKR